MTRLTVSEFDGKMLSHFVDYSIKTFTDYQFLGLIFTD